MPKLNQLMPQSAVMKQPSNPGTHSLTLRQVNLKQSWTASQLVDHWSGVLAEAAIQPDLELIAGDRTLPTLSDVMQVYGKATGIALISNHLQSLESLGNAKVTRTQFLDSALLIATEYYYFNLDELCLFFRRCKLGYYGQLVWGDRLNIQQVLTGLHTFVMERREAVSRRQNREYAQHQQLSAQAYGESLHGGLNELHTLQQQARSEMDAFCRLFPRVPDAHTREEWWHAWQADADEVGRVLCAYCCQGR